MNSPEVFKLMEGVETKNYSMALAICFMHLGGDIPSPIIIGSIWDSTKNAAISIEYSSIGIILSAITFTLITYKFINIEKNMSNHQTVLDYHDLNSFGQTDSEYEVDSSDIYPSEQEDFSESETQIEYRTI